MTFACFTETNKKLQYADYMEMNEITHTLCKHAAVMARRRQHHHRNQLQHITICIKIIRLFILIQASKLIKSALIETIVTPPKESCMQDECIRINRSWFRSHKPISESIFKVITVVSIIPLTVTLSLKYYAKVNIY